MSNMRSHLLRWGLALAFLPFAVIGARADERVIRISSDPWEPFVIGSVGGKPSGGIGVKMAEEVFRRVGVPIDIAIFPYDQCLNQMKTGERDVLLLAKKTPEREQYMVYSDVAVTEKQQLYYSLERRGRFSWQNWSDLRGLTIGGVRGFDYGDLPAKAAVNGYKMELASDDTKNIRDLLAGRIDLAVLNDSTVNYYMQNNPAARGKLTAAQKNIAAADFHFALSKQGRALPHLAKINVALREMYRDGTMAKILLHYQ